MKRRLIMMIIAGVLAFLLGLLGRDKDELLISIQGETVKTVIGLKDLHQALNIFGVSIMLPIKAKHKLFGDVEIIGIRTECSSNNNKMYMVKNDGEYYWVYDYETELIGN